MSFLESEIFRSAKNRLLDEATFDKSIRLIKASPGLYNFGIRKLETYTRPNFSIEQTLRSMKGPLIEIGGPTKDGYKLVDIDQFANSILISNIWPKDRVDLFVNGCSMPFRDNSVSAIFVSHMMFYARQSIIDETYRTLKPNGLLIWEGGTAKDSLYACDERGFQIMEYAITFSNVVFQKPLI